MIVHLMSAAVLVATCVASAQQTPPVRVDRTHTTPSARSDQAVGDSLKQPTKDPYAKLFPAQDAQMAATREALMRFREEMPGRLRSPNGKIVCGMTVWTVTPELDPRSIVKPPVNGADYKMGKIAPPVCVE